MAIVVLTWNGREHTLGCLNSLSRLEWPNLDIIVVDNASHDGTEEAVRELHPDVEILQTGRNLGFAGGNNVGIRKALRDGADAVLILNNDTEVAPDLVGRLVRTLEEGENLGAVSPVVRFASSEAVWFAGSHYNPAKGRGHRLSAWERNRRPLPDRPVEIDRGVGAAMLVPAPVIERLGSFDSDLFYLYEDVEWSLRIRAAGLRIALEPRTQVRHHVGGSQGGASYTPLTVYYGTRNALVVGDRYAGLVGLRAWWRELKCVAVYLLAARRAGRQWLRCAFAAVEGWWDYKRGHLGRHPRRP